MRIKTKEKGEKKKTNKVYMEIYPLGNRHYTRPDDDLFSMLSSDFEQLRVFGRSRYSMLHASVFAFDAAFQEMVLIHQ